MPIFTFEGAKVRDLFDIHGLIAASARGVRKVHKADSRTAKIQCYSITSSARERLNRRQSAGLLFVALEPFACSHGVGGSKWALLQI